MANGVEFIPALLLAIIMTLVGSLAKYANRPILEKIRLRDHIAISVFAGMMMFLYGLHEQWSVYLIGIGCGLAGWQGAAIIKRIHPPGFQDNGEDDDGKN
ncbi:TPA: holin [Citrobacter murliniae]